MIENILKCFASLLTRICVHVSVCFRLYVRSYLLVYDHVPYLYLYCFVARGLSLRMYCQRVLSVRFVGTPGNGQASARTLWYSSCILHQWRIGENRIRSTLCRYLNRASRFVCILKIFVAGEVDGVSSTHVCWLMRKHRELAKWSEKQFRDRSLQSSAELEFVNKNQLLEIRGIGCIKFALSRISA